MLRIARMIAAAGACLGAVVLSGCVAQAPPRAIAMIREGTTALQHGDDQTVIRQMNDFLKEFGHTSVADRAYYLRAEAQFRLKQDAAARADFQEAADRTRDKAVRGNALAGLGDLAWQRGDVRAAEKYYRRALDNLDPSKRPAGMMRYRLGCALQRQGRWDDADVQFNRAVYFFQGTPLARLAGRRVNARAWSVQAGAFVDPAQADALAARLKAKGLNARVDLIATDQGPQFAVTVGRYPTYAQAEAALPKVRAQCPSAFAAVVR